jgi:hypothetical protein
LKTVGGARDIAPTRPPAELAIPREEMGGKNELGQSSMEGGRAQGAATASPAAGLAGAPSLVPE